MARLRGAAIVAASLVVASPAFAQTDPMSLADAQRTADQRAPDLLVASARAGVAGADVPVAGMLANPTLTLGSALNSAHFYTAISVPLPLSGQRHAAIEAAEASATAARRDVDVTRLDVRLATALAWVDAWLAVREAAITDESAQRSARLLAVTEERFASGVAPRLDVLRARADALRLAADARAATRLVLGAAARLSVWLGRPVDAASLGAVEDPRVDSLPALTALVARLEAHPALAAAHARVGAADATTRLERRRRWPLIAVEVGGTFFDPTFATVPGAPVPAFADAHVALGFEVPLLNVHGPVIARAQAVASQAVLEAQLARTRLVADATAAYAALEAATMRERAQVDDVLPATREAADLALEGYRAGRGDVTVVLSAQQALAEAHRVAVQLEADRIRARATLEHAIGRAL